MSGFQSRIQDPIHAGLKPRGNPPWPEPTWPIVFPRADLEPADVRVVALTFTYHLHSQVLREYTGYFRVFLDQPTFAASVNLPAGAPFAYEYVTEIDDGGNWSVVALSANNGVCPKSCGIWVTCTAG